MRFALADRMSLFHNIRWRKKMKEYKFYGWKTADVPAVNEEYKAIKGPRHLYDLLSEIWCADTCAPRMREDLSLIHI